MRLEQQIELDTREREQEERFRRSEGEQRASEHDDRVDRETEQQAKLRATLAEAEAAGLVDALDPGSDTLDTVRQRLKVLKAKRRALYR